VKTEIAAMQDLCHQHICKLYQVIETTERFYMVLEVIEVYQKLCSMSQSNECEYIIDWVTLIQVTPVEATLGILKVDFCS